MKRGREYLGCVEEYNVKKESFIMFPIQLKLLGRLSSGEKGKRTEILGKQIKI